MEEETELAECMYFGAIEKLKDVQKDLTKLDDVQRARVAAVPLQFSDACNPSSFEFALKTQRVIFTLGSELRMQGIGWI